MKRLLFIPGYQLTLIVIVMILYLTLLPQPLGEEEFPLFEDAFGALIEWLQYAMALGRAGNDVWDALANTLGAFTAVPICYWLHWINVVIKNRT